MFNSKNYKEQGGDTVRFGGRVVFGEDCRIQGLPKVISLPTDSDFSEIIAAMKEAGYMYSADWDIRTMLVPSPADEVLVRNNAKVESISYEDGTITVVVNPDELEESELSNTSQGIHKWLALSIATGVVPITEVKYNGLSFTDQDLQEAARFGCGDGAFVLFIKADDILSNAKTFILSAAEHYELSITVRVKRPTDWLRVLTCSNWQKIEGSFSDSMAAILLNDMTSVRVYPPRGNDCALVFMSSSFSVSELAEMTGSHGVIPSGAYTLEIQLSESDGVYSMAITDSLGSVVKYVKDGQNINEDCFNISEEGVIEKKTGVEIPALLNIPIQINEIEVTSVEDCKALSDLAIVTVPERVRIQEMAFAGCSNLRYLVLNGLNEIDSNAFYECSILNNVVMFGSGYVLNPTSFADNETTVFSYKGTDYIGYSSLYAAWQSEQQEP